MDVRQVGANRIDSQPPSVPYPELRHSLWISHMQHTPRTDDQGKPNR